MHMGAPKRTVKSTPKGVRFAPDVFAEIRRITRKPRSFSPTVNALLREALDARAQKAA